MQKKVSIIVPIYNVEKYLSRCLDSILSQMSDDMEVVCIEDCSTDGSASVLREYEKSDDRVKAFYNKSNLGLGGARNVGIENSVGKYIWFVDSDDWIEEGAIQELYSLCEAENLDLVLFGAKQIYESEEVEEKTGYISCQRVSIDRKMDGEEAYLYLKQRSAYDDTACRKFIKKELIENLRFETGVYYEDEVFSLKTLLRANGVKAVQKNYYNYYRHNNSITVVNGEINTKHLVSCAVMLDGVRDVLEKTSGYIIPELADHFGRLSKTLYDKFEVIDSIDRDILAEYGSARSFIELVGSNYYGGYFPYKLSPITMELLRNKKHIYIYGAGNVGKALLKLLTERNVEVDGFLVTESPDVNVIMEKKVSPIDVIFGKDLNDTLVLIMVDNVDACMSMKEKVLSTGCKDNNILTYRDIR